MNLLALTWPQAWELIAWTMCYFFVLGTMIALAGTLLRWTCRRAAPSIRYTTTLAVFAALAISPIGIAAWLNQTAPTATAPSITKPNIAPPSGRKTTSPLPPPVVVPETSRPEGRTMYEPLLLLHRTVTYLPWLWLIGAPITFALLATGLVGSERLRRNCTPITTGIVAETCLQLSKSLHITRQVSLALCDRIAQPILIGILRPLILLPPAALTGWSPEELEMVLLHELAHVRRWDNLVNLLQRLVESLLFFHPAIWLVSRQVRHDREQCCDAVVVAYTAAPQAYAKLLINIATSPPPLAGLALARHPLTARIRRILKLEDEPMLVSRRTLGFVTVALVAIATFIVWQLPEKTVAGGATDSTLEQKGESEKKDPTLFYDGKTFDQWRDMWKTELKTENRTECVNALAAFARAGHAKEAAETILDVAGEYDFTQTDKTPEGKLKQRVLDILSKKIPASQWLKSLLERYDTDEEKWEKLTHWLLRITEIIDEPSRQQLLNIANSDHSLNRIAIGVLIQNDRSMKHPETVKLAHKALQGEHPILPALYGLGFQHLDQVPEQIDLLFHENAEVRKGARRALPPVAKSRQLVMDKLLNVLNDPVQREKHVHAIRALSYFRNSDPFGTNKQNPPPQISAALLKIAREGDDQLLGSAIVALSKLWNNTDSEFARAKLLYLDEAPENGSLSESRKKLLNDAEAIKELVRQEEQFVTPLNPSYGGGGGFGGGGGGGFF